MQNVWEGIWQKKVGDDQCGENAGGGGMDLEKMRHYEYR